MEGSEGHSGRKIGDAARVQKCQKYIMVSSTRDNTDGGVTRKGPRRNKRPPVGRGSEEEGRQ